jgi:hypothetical protein
MQTETLFKIFLGASILGTLLLLLIPYLAEPKSAAKYSQLKEGECVKVTGKAVSIKTSGSMQLIKLDSNITLTCTGCKFKENQTLEATGKVENYNNKLEINAEKIKVRN